MLETCFGAMLGIGLTHLVWSLHVSKLRKSYRETLESAERLQLEYFEFRRRFEEYRARYDPLDLTHKGNVTYINKGKE